MSPLFASKPFFGRAKRAHEFLPSAPHNHDFPPSSLLVLSIIYHVGQALSMGFYKFFCEKFIFLTLFFGRFHRKYSPSPQKNAVQNCLFHNILLPHRFLTPFVGIPPLLCSARPLFRVFCPCFPGAFRVFFVLVPQPTHALRQNGRPPAQLRGRPAVIGFYFILRRLLQRLWGGAIRSLAYRAAALKR